jgi:hypothetical protein
MLPLLLEYTHIVAEKVRRVCRGEMERYLSIVPGIIFRYP